MRQLHDRVLDQSLRRAEIEGATAQQVRAKDLINDALPTLQAGLSLWHRVIPRSVLTLVCSVILALLIHPWLAILAIATACLLWKGLVRLRTRHRGEVTDWEVPRYRERMSELVGRAPLLARLQTPGLTSRAFASQTDQLYRRLQAQDAQIGRIWPLVFLAVAAAISVLLLGLGVNSFQGVDDLRLPSAMILILSLAAALAAASRLITLSTQLPVCGDASNRVYQYLQQIGDAAPTEQRVGMAGVRDGVKIDGASLLDSTSQPLLANLSLTLTTGTMTALLGTDDTSTRTLAELLMGFGTPSQGRVSIDGIPLRDIHPKSLADNVMWIEPDGPIWDGSIIDNIRGRGSSIHHGDVTEVLQRLDVYERLHRLPDGLSTIVSSTENDLGVETTYAIAVARAMVHRVPILLVSEPPPPAEPLQDDPCLKALLQLVSQGTIVVVLPRRLPTLRAANRVILLNGPRQAGEGTHADLLTQSDLYRHLNYLLFNPYRGQR